MAKRMQARSSPKSNSVSVLASSDLPVPVGPARNMTPRGFPPAHEPCEPLRPVTRALHDVERLGDGGLLAFDATADKVARVRDFIPGEPLPRVFRDAELVAAHGLADVL